MTRCTSSGLTRKPLNMSFGCAHTELKAITLASDHGHLWGGNGMPIHLEGVVKEPLADFGHSNNERMPIDEATESFARGIRRHRNGCLNGQTYFTDECIQREVASPQRCFVWMTPPEVQGSSSTADGPPCQGVIGVQLAGNFSRGVQGRTSSSLLAGEITFQVDRFESAPLILSVDHGCCVPPPGAIQALAHKRHQSKTAFPIFHSTSSKKRMEEAIEALFAAASMLSINTATFPNAFRVGWMGSRTSAKAEHAPGPYFRQSSPALDQIPRHLLGRLQSGLARRLIGRGSLRSSDPLYIHRQHAPLVSTAAPQVNRVTPPIYGKVNAVKRFWSNSYCHLSHSDCTQFDSAMSALWPQGRKTASRRDARIQQRVSPGARFACAFSNRLDDAFERSELSNLRFAFSSIWPFQNHGGEKSACHRINDQVQFNIPMHHAHFAHPRLSTQLKESSCAVAWLPLRTARKTATSPTASATSFRGLTRPCLLAVDLLYRETHTDIQRLLQGGRIRQVQLFVSLSSLNPYGVHECTPSIRLPRLHRESDAEQRAIYVFLQYETTAHPTNPMWRIGGIVFLAQHAVNAVKRCQDCCRTAQFLTIKLWIGRLRPGGRNDVVGNILPLLQGRKARVGMEVYMSGDSNIVDLDLLKLPARVALSYKLTRVGIPTKRKRDSSQTHTSLRRCLQAESAPGIETAQEGLLSAASKSGGEGSTARRDGYQCADVIPAKALGFTFSLHHAPGSRGRLYRPHMRAVSSENMDYSFPVPAMVNGCSHQPVGIQFCSGRHGTDSTAIAFDTATAPRHRHSRTLTEPKGAVPTFFRTEGNSFLGGPHVAPAHGRLHLSNALGRLDANPLLPSPAGMGPHA